MKVVQQVIRHWPRVSVQRVAAHGELQRLSMRRIIRHILLLFPYRIETCQLLSVSAINPREVFENPQLKQLDSGEIE